MFCVKVTQIAMMFVYLDMGGAVISSKNIAVPILVFRGFNRLFSAPFGCAVETCIAIWLQ